MTKQKKEAYNRQWNLIKIKHRILNFWDIHMYIACGSTPYPYLEPVEHNICTYVPSSIPSPSSSPDAIPVSRALYGQGIGIILYDEVKCTGVEMNVTDCPSDGLRVHDCQHSEDAGVLCRRKEETVAGMGGGGWIWNFSGHVVY